MNRHSFLLIFSILLIFSMGLMMVFNTTAAEVLNRSLSQSTHHALIKQLLYAFVGIIAACIVFFLGYEAIIEWSGIFLVLGTICLVLVFVPGIGQQINGAHRWINISGHTFQPSEFVKYLIPLYFIREITRPGRVMVLKEFFILLAKLAIPIALILIEPDNGTVAVILMSLIILLLLTRIRWIYWGAPLLILMLGGILAASRMPHVPDRIRIYLNPESDLLGKGHQPHQAKIAAGCGGFFGRGAGQSLQKLDYLPEARSDYIAAIFAEEFGFFGMSCLIFLYMSVSYFGFRLAAAAKTRAAFYTIAIFTFLIAFQAFLNLGVVSGLLPSKGINLPFFSQGGSSLIANMIILFLILNVAAEGRKKLVEN